ERGPGQGHERARRAQQRLRVAGRAHGQLVDLEQGRAAQAVAGVAAEADLEAEPVADGAQHQARQASGLHHEHGRERQEQEQARGRAHGERPPAARVHAPSASGSRASTKAWASNTRRSSGRSPMPAKRIGMPNSRASANTTPPLAVPSSLVTTSPVTPAACWKWRSWLSAFWPVVPSITISTSCGAD